MQIYSNKGEFSGKISELKNSGEKINFVPTMGNLHQGHIQLVKQAANLPGKTVVSIFVNPLQFGDSQDLALYPRTLAQDVEKLMPYCDLLFAPESDEMYAHQSTMTIHCNELATLWEGKSRPGHFDGMATVVAKLFNIMQADVAIFGEKDYQQLCIIKQMVKDLDFPVQILSQATVREENGLAMSSRNSRLTTEQRQHASFLYQCLLDMKKQLAMDSDYTTVQQQTIEQLNQQGFDCDYVCIVDANTLEPALLTTKEKIILAAVIFQGVRLIDNIALF